MSSMPRNGNGRLITLLLVAFGIITALLGVIYENLSGTIIRNEARCEAKLETVNAVLSTRGERITILEGKIIALEKTGDRMSEEHHTILQQQRR